MYKYSIIIPHYNIPDLLIRCLNSIPVSDDIQVIVIDDCSPQSNSYMERYPELSRPFLEFYSTIKGGSAGRARNVGLDHAKGKWVICMDADDLFVDDMEEILSYSFNREEDVLYFGYKTVLSSDLMKAGHRDGYQSYFEDNNIHDESLFRYSFDPMWGKIFKREMIEKYHIRCDETRYGNDVGFSFRCGALAKKIAVFNRPFFIITEREDSLASSQFSKKKCSAYEYKSRLVGAFGIMEFMKNYNINIKHRMYASLSYGFIKDCPLGFAKYYFTHILRSHLKIALTLPLLLCYMAFRRLPCFNSGS